MPRSKKYLGIFIVPIIVAGFLLLTIGINKPFWGHHDWNSVVYSNIARNYIRYGYFDTKLGQVTNHDVVSSNSFHYISHYPPLLPMLLSFSFRLFGQSETSARLVVVMFSLVLLFSLYKIGGELHSRLLGIFASCAILFTPIFLYFGKLPVHDTVVPSISALSFWFYLKFIKTNNNKYYWLLLLSLIFGGFVNWSALYLTVAVVIHQLIYKNSPGIRSKILLLIPISVAIFVLHVMHIRLLGVESERAFDNLLIRINPFLTADLYGFTTLKYIKQELLYLKVYYSPPLFIGAFLFMFVFAFSLIKKRLNLATSFIFSLLIYGLIQIAVFIQLSFIHDYMIYYMLPFMTLGTSYVLFMLAKKIRHSIVFPLFLIFILSFVLFSNFKYVQALLTTSEHKRGYEIARIINTQTASGEKSFIGSNSYKEFEEVFIGYYADRSVDYGESLPKDFDKTFKIILRPKDHDPLDEVSKKILDENYQKFQDEYFVWYKIKYIF